MSLYDVISRQEITGIIKDLIAIESHKNNEYMETRAAQYIRDFLTKEGIDSELDWVKPNRPNVYGYLGERTKEPELMFNGHIDTIPGFHMDYPAFEPFIEENVVYGRGACDMKGGIAGYMAAFAAAKRAGLTIKKPIMFAGVIGEEDCSGGTERLIKQKFRPKYAVIGEPTNLQLCTAHKGFEWMQVTMIGRSCHGSSPKDGKNAIYAAAYFCELVQRELEPLIESRPDPLLGPGSVCVGVIGGGNDPNIVPDRCFVQLDRRWLPTETLESICGEVIGLAEKTAAKYQCNYEFRQLKELRASMVNLPYSLPACDELVQTTLRLAQQVRGEPQQPTVWKRGWTDAGLLSNYAQTKCVVIGPGGVSQAHANNEYCSLDEICQAAEIYYKLIGELCK